MHIKSKCGHEFMAKMAPCPDNRDGCLVLHYDENSYICPECGYDAGPYVGSAIMEGRHTIEPGIAIMNIKAISKLKFD